MRLASLFLLLAGAAPAQLFPGHFGHGASGGTYTIEAFVGDAAGHMVPNLTEADFSLESRKPVKIASCTYVDMRARRTMAFVVDDLSLTNEGIGQVRAALEKFVDGLQPEDRLAILRSGSGDGELQQLTRDKALLHQALQRLYYNPRQAFYVSATARATAFNTGAIGAVREAIVGLQGVPGRKFVVLFSMGLSQQPVTDLEALTGNARRGLVSVYGIEMSAEAGSTALNQFSGVGVTALIKRSGGELLDGGTTLDQALADNLNQPNGYYLIRYARTQEEDWPPDLKVQKPGLRLLSMRRLSGSEAAEVSADPLMAAPRVGEDDLVRAVSDPLSTAQIRTRVTPLFYNTPQGSTLVVLVHVDARDLSVRKSLDGAYHGGGRILVAVFGSTGQSIENSENRFDVTWSETQYQQALRAGVVVAQRLPVRSNMMQPRDSAGAGTGEKAARSAMLRVYAVAGDDESGRMGSANQWLEVPDVDDGRLEISGIELSGLETQSTPDRFQLKEPDETPAVRIFRGNQPIHYHCDLYNLTAPAGQTSQVELRLTLFREGHMEFSPPVLIDLQPGTDPHRSSLAGHLTLPASLQPGRYMVRFTVTDKGAPEGPARIANQFVDFELRP